MSQATYTRSLRIRVLCPHCEAQATIRSSRVISPISREIYFQCANVECGHTWKSLMSIVNTIVPSQMPNPSVHIPFHKKATLAPDG